MAKLPNNWHSEKVCSNKFADHITVPRCSGRIQGNSVSEENEGRAKGVTILCNSYSAI